jgi:hypothetical protein
MIASVATKPAFVKKYLTSRGLAPVFDSADDFANGLVADRAEGLSVIKASGLYAKQ